MGCHCDLTGANTSRIIEIVPIRRTNLIENSTKGYGHGNIYGN